MQYAIELYFDAETERRLMALSQKIADEGISTKFLEWKTRPHLTLACFSDVDEEDCANRLKNFAKTHGQLPAWLGSVGMFTDSKTIFASPIMNTGMYRFQRELHECMQCFDTKGWEWYLPERWVPHCTIALTKEDGEEAFLKASRLVLKEFQKTAGKFTAIGLVKISFPVQEIVCFELAE